MNGIQRALSSSVFLGLCIYGCGGGSNDSSNGNGGSSNVSGGSFGAGGARSGGATSSNAGNGGAKGGATSNGGAEPQGGADTSASGGLSSAPGGAGGSGASGDEGGESGAAQGGVLGAGGTLTQGGTTNGGSASGGKATGGSTSNGGAASGGATSNGGAASGGANGGSTSMGGKATGGSTSNGGAASGGAASGGANGGSTSTGGKANGGSTSMGGTASGGTNSTGGTGATAGGPTCSAAIGGASSVGGVAWADDFDSSNPLDGIEGSWSVDNSLAQAGTRAIHPPLQGASGGTAELAIKCGNKPHSELSFWVAGINPTAAQQLKFYVDDVLYTTYGKTNDCCHNFNNVKIVVPSGTHRYRWVASTDAAGQSPYWIDTIQCLDNPITANASGRFEFEEGFVPPEAGGEFVIDNSLPEAGTFSAHPPLLAAAQKATLSFSCGCQDHSELSFWYAGVNPATGQDLKLYVDNVLYATYGKSNDCCHNFNQVDIILPRGQHAYRWEVTTPTAGQPPYWVDTIRCQ